MTADDDLETHIISTYFSLRVGLTVVAAMFPIVLAVGGRVLYGLPLQDSMSAYYHADRTGDLCTAGHGVMRDAFVGGLFAIAALLYAYRGYTRLENIMLNIASVLAAGTAVFPMTLACHEPGTRFTPHGFFAVAFFIAIAFVGIVCAPNTVHRISDPADQQRFKHLYRITGGVMLIAPMSVLAATLVFGRYETLTFWMELAGIYAFAFFWAVKSYEIHKTNTQRRAAARDGLAVNAAPPEPHRPVAV